MAKPSSVKKVPRKKVRVSRRRPNMGYGLFMTGLVAAGSLLVVVSRDDQISADDRPGVAIGEHWHAFVGINICGKWQETVAPYNAASGVHSHGDGFSHMHPQSSAGAQEKATIGLFLGQATEDIEINTKSIRFENESVKNGDECKEIDNKEKAAGLRWSVNGTEKALGTNPWDYIPEDRDVVAIAFLPQDMPIGTPPGAATTPSDVNVPPPPAPGATTTTEPGDAESDADGESEPASTTSTSEPDAADEDAEEPTTTTTK